MFCRTDANVCSGFLQCSLSRLVFRSSLLAWRTDLICLHANICYDIWNVMKKREWTCSSTRGITLLNEVIQFLFGRSNCMNVLARTTTTFQWDFSSITFCSVANHARIKLCHTQNKAQCHSHQRQLVAYSIFRFGSMPKIANKQFMYGHWTNMEVSPTNQRIYPHRERTPILNAQL